MFAIGCGLVHLSAMPPKKSKVDDSQKQIIEYLVQWITETAAEAGFKCVHEWLRATLSDHTIFASFVNEIAQMYTTLYVLDEDTLQRLDKTSEEARHIESNRSRFSQLMKVRKGGN